MVGGKDVNFPEQWGFLHNQVTPFRVETSDGHSLHAWHILPLEVYRQNEAELIDEPSGEVLHIEQRKAFRLLKDDPDALLVLYLHGAAGTLASGHRPQSYRAISAMSPSRIHILAIDYRGFGTNGGTPSESGLLIDALALADFAMSVAGIPPERTVIFSQSLGTAVALALIRTVAARPDPKFYAGLVMVAPFVSVQKLTATYKIAGVIPILSPLARFPALMNWFAGFIDSKWPSIDVLRDFVRHCEESLDSVARYRITIVHARDDWDIPWEHGEELFWAAVATAEHKFQENIEVLADHRELARQQLGSGGWKVEKKYNKGVLWQYIPEHGLHDWTMGHPVVSMAIWKTFLESFD
ncbi:hypothetical protein ANO11243_060160 [Dothideomycetidae sp. 11243]|nr:hypothetical protein ANO11243_060160 [fungal sp. No.11243]